MRRADSKVLLLIAALLTPFLFIGGPEPFASRSFQALWNLGHAILFFCLVDGAIRARPAPVRKAPVPWSAGIVVATVLIALLIEWLQGFVGREQSLHDVWTGLGGALLGLLHAPMWPSGRRSALARVCAGSLIFVLVGRPLGLALLDESRARASFPVLSDFTSSLELGRWNGSAALTIQPAVEGEHDGAMVIRMAPRRNSFHLGYFPDDWSEYRTLLMRVRYDGPPRDLTCRLNDLAHDLAVPHDPADHYEIRLPLQSGWQELSIDLEIAATSIPNRRMDLATINSLTCFLPRLQEEVDLVLDRVSLGGRR